jgi:phage gp29-like protein
VPIVEGQPGASPRELEAMSKMAQNFKVGEDSGGSLPSGAKIDIKRMGSGTDVVNSIRYHDESMARLFLHMFIQLGQTETGSRALGQSFIEYAFIAQKAVAKWFADVTNEHVIEDWVDWNYENEDNVPRLVWEIQEEDEHLAVEELVKLVTAKVVTVDEEMENTLRERYHLPPLTGPRPDPQPAPVIPPVAPEPPPPDPVAQP